MESFKNKFGEMLSKSNSCSYLQFDDVNNIAYIGWKSERSQLFNKFKYLMKQFEDNQILTYNFDDIDCMMEIKILEPVEKQFEIEI